MKDFKIEIRETLSREIDVKADSFEEALEKIKNDYFDEEIVLLFKLSPKKMFYEIFI